MGARDLLSKLGIIFHSNFHKYYRLIRFIDVIHMIRMYNLVIYNL